MKKDKIELTYTNPQDIEQPKVIESDIHTKYADLIKAALDGNITGKWNCDMIYELKRYIEKKTLRSVPIEWNCEDCLISLIKTFNNYK